MLNILLHSIVSCMLLKIGLLVHRVCVCSAVVDTAKQLLKVVVSGCTPTSQCIKVCVAPNPC